MPEPEMVTLIFPPGEWAWTYPVSHGDVCYWPYSSGQPGTFDEWYIDVPREVAAPLIAKGGFRVAQTTQTTVIVQTDAMVRMRHPDGPRSFGWSPGPGSPGVSFNPDVDGIVEIPVEAVPIAQEAFGFVPAPPKATPAKAEPVASEKPAARR